MSMLTDHDPLIDDFLRRFEKLTPEEQTIVYGKIGQNFPVPVAVGKKKRTFEELCGVWDTEERREDTERMVQAIHEGRMLGTEREPL